MEIDIAVVVLLTLCSASILSVAVCACRRIDSTLQAAWHVVSYMNAHQPLAAQLGQAPARSSVPAAGSSDDEDGAVRSLGAEGEACRPWSELEEQWGGRSEGAASSVPDLSHFVQTLNVEVLAYLIQVRSQGSHATPSACAWQ